MKRLRSLEGFSLLLAVLSLLFGIIQGIASWDTAMDRISRWLPAISDGIRVLATIANIPMPLWIVTILLTGIPLAWAYLQKRAKKLEIDRPIEIDVGHLAKDDFLGVLILTNTINFDSDPQLLCRTCNSRIIGATQLDGLIYLVCENQHCVGNEIPFEQSLENAKKQLKQWEKNEKKRKAQAEKERLEVRAKVESGELTESDYDKFLRSFPVNFQDKYPPFVPTDGIPLLRESEFIMHQFYEEYRQNLLKKNLHKIPNIKG